MSSQRPCARIVPVLAVLAAACSDAAGVDQVVPSLSVDAPAVSAGDAFQAVLMLSNPTGDTVRFEAPNSCLAMLRVLSPKGHLNRQMGQGRRKRGFLSLDLLTPPTFTLKPLA